MEKDENSRHSLSQWLYVLISKLIQQTRDDLFFDFKSYPILSSNLGASLLQGT